MAKLGKETLSGMGGIGAMVAGGGGVPRQFKPGPSSANLAGFGSAAGSRPAPVSPGLRAPGR